MKAKWFFFVIATCIVVALILARSRTRPLPKRLSKRQLAHRLEPSEGNTQRAPPKYTTTSTTSEGSKLQGDTRALLKDLRKLYRQGIRTPYWEIEQDPLYRKVLNRARQSALDLNILREAALNPLEPKLFRVSLVRIIGEMSGEGPFELLLRLFKDKGVDPSVRATALAALRRRESPKVFEAIQHVFRTEPNYPARHVLVIEMGCTQDERAIPIILEAIQPNQEKQIRYHAAQALRYFVERPFVQEKLKYYASEDPDHLLRRSCILSLATLQEARIKGFLEGLLRSERHPQIRKLLRHLLKRYKDGRR